MILKYSTNMLKIELEHLKYALSEYSKSSNSVQLKLIPKVAEIDGCPVLEATYQCTIKKSVLNTLNTLGDTKYVILYNRFGMAYTLQGMKLSYCLYKHRDKYDFLNPKDYNMPIHKWDY